MYYSEEKDIEIPINEQLIRVKNARLIVNETEIKNLLDKEIENLFPKKPTLGAYAKDVKEELIEAKLAANIYNYSWLSYFVLNMLRRKGLDVPVSKIQDYLKNSKKFESLRNEYEIAIIKDYIPRIIKYEKISGRNPSKQKILTELITTFHFWGYNLQNIKTAIMESENIINNTSLIQKAISKSSKVETTIKDIERRQTVVI